MEQIFTHGSEDSLDHDVYVIFDHIPSFKEAKAYCNNLKEYNANILVLKDGIVEWCFKGTEDECNNSLFRTYELHEQKYDLPISNLVQRDVELKIVRTIRGLLSYFSRTEIRSDVKKALKSDSFELKIATLRKCFLSYDIDYKKTNHKELFKFFAFQIGQTWALMHKGKELFTKSEVAVEYPELRDALYREDFINTETLQETLSNFLFYLETNIEKINDNEYSLFQKDTVFSFVEKQKFLK